MPVNEFSSVVTDKDGNLFFCGRNGSLQGEVSYSLKQVSIPRKIVSFAVANVSGTLAVDEDGSVWYWGFPGENLGSAVRVSVLSPQCSTLFCNITSVTAGHGFGLALDSTGYVWCFGRNVEGQLGLGLFGEHQTLIRNSYLRNIVQISAGFAFSLALDADGQVWGFGDYDSGQLGVDTETKINTCIPRKSVIQERITSISTGVWHSLALDVNKELWGFGSNGYGQLGLGDNRNRLIPTKVVGISNLIKIWCGGHYSFVKKDDGSMWGCGSNYYGELGLEDSVDRTYFTENPSLYNMELIHPGVYHWFSEDHRGDLYSCGSNAEGQLGQQGQTTVKTAQQIPNFKVHNRISKVKSAASNKRC
jgi:alpha-tubulin suppressor-like RCC1 family protein